MNSYSNFKTSGNARVHIGHNFNFTTTNLSKSPEQIDAEAVVDTLLNNELFRRREDISDTYGDTWEWIFKQNGRSLARGQKCFARHDMSIHDSSVEGNAARISGKASKQPRTQSSAYPIGPHDLFRSFREERMRESLADTYVSIGDNSVHREAAGISENAAAQPCPKNSSYSHGVYGLFRFLREDSGIFWIRGKPGSGKSTLMKFLADDLRTLDHVRQSAAGGRKVKILHHFFWIGHGLPEQSSYKGFLQSCLYQALKVDEKSLVPLVSVVCERRWRSRRFDAAWTIKELEGCLDTAFHLHGQLYCMFVDGLDECQSGSDQTQLLKMLKRLAAINTTKIVTASRPWTLFETAFHTRDKMLILEHCNGSEIVRYVQERIEDTAPDGTFSGLHWSWVCLGPSSYCPHRYSAPQKLIGQIIKKADGVFLWVELVVDMICQRLVAGNSVTDLHRRVDDLPEHLETYFRRMLFDRIHCTWKREAAMVLKLMLLGNNRLKDFWMLAGSSDHGGPPLLSPRFPYDTPFQDINWFYAPLMVQKVRKFLTNCCNDFLTMPKADGLEARVTFSHRTMSDFLNTPDMRKTIDAHTPAHFQSPWLSAQIRIATWKWIRTDGEPSVDRNACWSEMSDLLKATTEYHWPAELVAELETVAMEYWYRWPTDLTFNSAEIARTAT